MKTRRILLAVLAMCLPFLASAEKVEIDGICYNINAEDNAAEVAAKGSGRYWGEIVIPSSINYQNEVYNVTGIGGNAFRDCTNLTSVTIPNSVTSIGGSAFNNCKSLTSVTIPNSVTSISSSAFSGCSGLASIKLIEGNVVYDSRNNCNAIIITAENKLILGCKNTVIPNGVTSIGNGAFSECSGLTSVTIPNSVTSIEANAFRYCSSLTSVTIPNSVTSIGGSAFRYCSSLTSVTIPNSVTSIGGCAFDYCKGLTSVTIPNSVTSIGEYAFNNCNSLTSITIGNGVKSIGNFAFNCASLTSVYISDIAAWCNINFNNSSSNPLVGARHLYVNKEEVKDLLIPNGVTSISEYAFCYCSSLTSITIPNSVTSIGSSTFFNCDGLISIKVENGNAVYDSRDNCNAIIKTADNALLKGCINTVIPNSVTSISNGAFVGCDDMTSITIPNSVTSIGSSAFYGCKGLTSVTIGNGVNSIGSSAFGYCKGLTSVTIPNSVTSIGENAFNYCNSLTSITIGNNVNRIGDLAFLACDNIVHIYNYSKCILAPRLFQEPEDRDLPNGRETNLSGATFHVRYSLKGRYKFDYYEGYRNGYPKIIAIDLTTVDGVTYLVDFDNHKAQVIGTDNSTNEIKIESSVNLEGKDYIVSSIAEGAFKENVNITSVSIPNSVTTIPAYTFYGCSSLTSVTIGNGVTTIGDYAFCGCKSLESAEIGTNVGNIKERAFANIDKLNIVTCHSPSVPNTDRTAFENSYVDYVSLFVPEESVDDYKSTAPWSGFKSIKGKSFAAYTLTYMVDGEVYKTQTYEEGDAITPESAPTKDGYIFSGWEGLPEIMPAEDVTVNGTFTEIPPEKCCAPTIAISNGEIVFACETDGVTYHYDVKSLDDKTGEGHSIKLTNTYRVSVYASKEGYEDSDTATKDIEIPAIGTMGDANGDGVTNAADIVYVTNRILNSR